MPIQKLFLIFKLISVGNQVFISFFIAIMSLRCNYITVIRIKNTMVCRKNTPINPNQQPGVRQ